MPVLVAGSVAVDRYRAKHSQAVPGALLRDTACPPSGSGRDVCPQIRCAHLWP